jgi:hypothetical protein
VCRLVIMQDCTVDLGGCPVQVRVIWAELVYELRKRWNTAQAGGMLLVVLAEAEDEVRVGALILDGKVLQKFPPLTAGEFDSHC